MHTLQNMWSDASSPLSSELAKRGNCGQSNPHDCEPLLQCCGIKTTFKRPSAE